MRLGRNRKIESVEWETRVEDICRGVCVLAGVFVPLLALVFAVLI